MAYALTGETPDTVVLSIPTEPYVCMGYHRSPGAEINLERCHSAQLPVIRRQTGGGTVFIDDRQLFVQWIFHPARLPRMVENRFRLFCQPLIQTYQFFGINAFFFPPNDVHVRNRKIVGTGAGAIGNAEVVTGNFIFDFNPEIMAGLLNAPSDPFRRMALEGMQQYMARSGGNSKPPLTRMP
ncbi:MAG: lipoate--protein ligase family protein [Saprospirales bacterium]|nr:lipoate--protein ligase family protein [Saprospirales bacterium]